MGMLVIALGIAAEEITVFVLKLSGLYESRGGRVSLAFILLASIFSKMIWMILMKSTAAILLRRKNAGDMGKAVETAFLERQYEHLQEKYADFEGQWLKLRRMKHDLRNNYVLEMGYLEKGEYGLLMEHYQRQLGELTRNREMLHTGNIGIDSIVSYKLKEAEKLKIKVERTIEITGKVTLSHIDLNILIGNLMDNAIEAVRALDEHDRKISLLIRTDQTALYLEISNPFKGEPHRDRDGNFLTAKADKLRHGLGLKEVKEIVRKYEGHMETGTEKNTFSVKILVYMG